MAFATLPRGRWGHQVHRLTAAIAVVLQVMLLFAPLSEIRDARAASAARAELTHRIGGSVDGGSRSTAPIHDESTCPACIARSLHARLESLTPLPVLAVEERTPPAVASVVRAHADPPTFQLSRAPPVAS